MIRKIISIILVAVLALSCASGCTQDPVQPNGVAVKQELTLDTAAISSRGQFVETENGYYYSVHNRLLYADKSDLTKWVLVCNDPSCKHMDYTCSADVFGGIAMRDGRLVSLRNTEDFKIEDMSGYGIYSMAPDGTDLQLEYFIEESRGVNEGSYMGTFFDGNDKRYFGMSILQNDGTYLNKILTVSENYSTVLAEAASNDMSQQLIFSEGSMRGDVAFYTYIYAAQEEVFQHLYRVTDNELEDISGILEYSPQCGYLSGDDLYHYVPEKGYYHTQISTGKSQKMMDAQLKDGIGYHFMGNFVVEHNMTYDHIPDEPQMMIYNGEQWIEVEIPADFEHTGESVVFPLALTTEHIFFEGYSTGVNSLYFINHKDPNPVLTLCRQF